MSDNVCSLSPNFKIALWCRVITSHEERKKQKTKVWQACYQVLTGAYIELYNGPDIFPFIFSDVWNRNTLPSQLILQHPEDILNSSANTYHPAYQSNCSTIWQCLKSWASFYYKIVIFVFFYHMVVETTPVCNKFVH